MHSDYPESVLPFKGQPIHTQLDRIMSKASIIPTPDVPSTNYMSLEIHKCTLYPISLSILSYLEF